MKNGPKHKFEIRREGNGLTHRRHEVTTPREVKDISEEWAEHAEANEAITIIKRDNDETT